MSDLCMREMCRQGPTCCELTSGAEEVCSCLWLWTGTHHWMRSRFRWVCFASEHPVFIENLFRLFPGQRKKVKELFLPVECITDWKLIPMENVCFLAARAVLSLKKSGPCIAGFFLFGQMRTAELHFLKVEKCLAQQENKTPGRLF